VIFAAVNTDGILANMILSAYDRILNGTPFADLSRMADENKRHSLRNVI